MAKRKVKEDVPKSLLEFDISQEKKQEVKPRQTKVLDYSVVNIGQNNDDPWYDWKNVPIESGFYYGYQLCVLVNNTYVPLETSCGQILKKVSKILDIPTPQMQRNGFAYNKPPLTHNDEAELIQMFYKLLVAAICGDKVTRIKTWHAFNSIKEYIPRSIKKIVDHYANNIFENSSDTFVVNAVMSYLYDLELNNDFGGKRTKKKKITIDPEQEWELLNTELTREFDKAFSELKQSKTHR